MSETPAFPQRPAFEIAPGNAVLRTDTAGRTVLGVKVQRRGRNYVQDYVIDLVPAAEPEIRLDFVDPEVELTDCGAPLRFETGPDADPALGWSPPVPGDLVRAGDGLFLAVREYAPPHRFVSFVNLETGNLRRLRAGAMTARFADWQVTGLGGNDPLPLEELMARQV